MNKRNTKRVKDHCASQAKCRDCILDNYCREGVLKFKDMKKPRHIDLKNLPKVTK